MSLAPYPGGSPAFDAAVALVLRDEGGYSGDPDDAGNWTGGIVGSGDLNGTNFGISAGSYPALNIRYMTEEQAIGIYWRDWWTRYHFDLLPAPFGGKCFDIGVNVGPRTAIRLLQEATLTLGGSLRADGMIGPDTASIVSRLTTSVLWDAFVQQIETHYRLIVHANPRDQRYLVGWLRRADETMNLS